MSRGSTPICVYFRSLGFYDNSLSMYRFFGLFGPHVYLGVLGHADMQRISLALLLTN